MNLVVLSSSWNMSWINSSAEKKLNAVYRENKIFVSPSKLAVVNRKCRTCYFLGKTRTPQLEEVILEGPEVQQTCKEDRALTLKLSAPINKSVLMSFPREEASVHSKWSVQLFNPVEEECLAYQWAESICNVPPTLTILEILLLGKTGLCQDWKKAMSKESRAAGNHEWANPQRWDLLLH